MNGRENAIKYRGIYTAILLLLLFCLFSQLRVFSILDQRPQSVHQWAQCDRASVALCYAQEDMNFFKPRVHEVSNGTGITGLEFPAINYTVAILYKVFGYHEFLYRLTTLTILCLGLYAAFLLVSRFTNNHLLALAFTLLFYLSPTLVYFSASFLSDVPALGLLLMSWYFFFRYKDNPSTKNILLFTILVSLATLIKLSAAVSLFTMFLVLGVDHFRLFDKRYEKKLFARPRLVFCLLLSGILLVIAWYVYVRWLSMHYKSNYFLLESNTPDSLSKYIEVAGRIFDVQIANYYYYYTFAFFILSGAFILCFIKRLHRLLLFITLSLYAGGILFMLVMFIQFIYHDYYFIVLMPAFLFHLLLLADVLKQFSSRFVVPLLLLFLVPLIYCSVRHIEGVLDKRFDKDNWQYGNKAYDRYFKMEPYLRTLGIKRSDRVLSIFDWSPNTTLYLINQKGISISDSQKDFEINIWLLKGVEYCMVNDSSFFERPIARKFTAGHLIGNYEGVLIYKGVR